ncbi:hypothetical protein [Paenibacillus sp. FSL H8-0259]|uniref:hypothetical protein n=1 Tax=Paenibacillus sp. FSL H8-0259 TaxID=1920423 RepID=UPI00096EB4C1|nr:hypothetical protein [Paenibacillus sp. FSL H8-0259]
MNNMLDEQALLRWRLEQLENQFSPVHSMIREKYTTNGYHTALQNVEQVHSIRSSIEYAQGLLDTGLTDAEDRAFAVIRQIVSLQDHDPASVTYGIWSYYLEEPLSSMRPPDWNWADFIGKVLLTTVIRHKHRMPAELLDRVRESVFHACESIIRRNMGPHYTNIAIMGSFVTLLAGEVFQNPRYLDYGLQKFEAFHQYASRTRTFQEYNSPTYTKVAIIELSRIRSATRIGQALEICEDMLNLAWEGVARHFHASTGQWAGPHSRCYSTLLPDAARAFLQLALEGELDFCAPADMFYDLEWYNLGISCPESYRALFREAAEREVREVYYRSEDGYEKTAVTYMTTRYALGSASKEVMWNQRRNLLAYVDGPGGTVYAALRMLHDGYDFSAPVFSAEQRKGNVLCGLQLSLNGGDTHIGLDRIDGGIQAEDLRLRLEIGGRLDGVTANAVDGGAVVSIGGVKLSLRGLYTRFAGGATSLVQNPEWEIVHSCDTLCLDLVLYSGERRRIDFTALDEAAVVFTLSVREDEGRDSSPDSFFVTMSAAGNGEEVTASWSTEDGELALNLRLKPDMVEALRGQD